jgi:hypothetical protein
MIMFVFGQKLYHQEVVARNAERNLDLECGGKRSATPLWIGPKDPKPSTAAHSKYVSASSLF